MIIQVEVVPTLEDYVFPESDRFLGEGRWEIENGATVRDVLRMIRLDWPILWIVINGQMSGKRSLLHDGDALRITPVVGMVG
jgi:hypothetical protein